VLEGQPLSLLISDDFRKAMLDAANAGHRFSTIGKDSSGQIFSCRCLACGRRIFEFSDGKTAGSAINSECR